MKPTACVLTNGCPENRIDAARMLAILERNGYRAVQDCGQASLILFNACALTESMEENSIRCIKLLKQIRRRDARMIVCGCLSKVNPRRLETCYSGPTFGSDDVDELIRLLQLRKADAEIQANVLVPSCTENAPFKCNRSVWKKAVEVLNPVKTAEKIAASCYNRSRRKINICGPDRFYIKVSTGCRHACAYCAVKLSRGFVNSKSIEAIAGEFEAGLAAGFTQFSLIGTDLGSYGIDRGEDLVILLQHLLRTPGQYTLRLRNIHPVFIIDHLTRFREVIRSGRIIYLSASAQSGSNAILALMKRRYRIEDFIAAIKTLRAAYPPLQIRTQLMVGFPGESDRDFEASLNLLDNGLFDFVETFKYSPRPGTAALRLENQVPASIARQRFRKLYTKALVHAGFRGLKAA